MAAADVYNITTETLFNATFTDGGDLRRGKDLDCMVGISALQWNVPHSKEHYKLPISMRPSPPHRREPQIQLDLRTDAIKTIVLDTESAEIVLKPMAGWDCANTDSGIITNLGPPSLQKSSAWTVSFAL